MKGLQRMTVRVRLLATVTLLLAVGFLTTNLVSFQISRAALKSTILHNELPLTSSNIYSEIQVDLLRPIFVSSLMSHDTFLRDWILAGEKDPTSVVRYLDEIRSKYGVFTTFVVSDKSREYYHFSGPTKKVDEADWRDAWFFRVRKMTTPYEINIDYNQAQGDAITIFINYKLLDYQGNFIGATGVGLKVDSVARIVARYRDDFQRDIYFVDHDGKVTVHSNDRAATDIRTAPGLKDIAGAILSSNQGFFEYRRANGELILLTTRLIPELGWWVVVEQRESQLIRDLWHAFLTNLAIGLGIILLTMGAIAYTINLYQKRLEDMASTDKLTGIGNRQVFDFTIVHALKQRNRDVRPLSVILFDLDHFKAVNDRYGHLKGDLVLCRVVDVIRRSVREGDVLCRWGGEELILFVEDCPEAEACRLADGIRKAVEMEPMLTPDEDLRVTVSAGVAQARPGDDSNSLIARADERLYRAKAEGRNRVDPPPAQEVGTARLVTNDAEG